MLGRPLMARQPPFGQKLSFTEASPFVQAAFFTEHALRHSHLTPSLVQWGILLRQLLLTASFFWNPNLLMETHLREREHAALFQLILFGNTVLCPVINKTHYGVMDSVFCNLYA